MATRAMVILDAALAPVVHGGICRRFFFLS